jgi:hypothetical protein
MCLVEFCLVRHVMWPGISQLTCWRNMSPLVFRVKEKLSKKPTRGRQQADLCSCKTWPDFHDTTWHFLGDRNFHSLHCKNCKSDTVMYLID